MKRKLYNEKLICIIYILIIFVSMYPNKENIQNISKLNTVIPGIEKRYNKNNPKVENNSYSFKSFEIIKKIIKK